MDCRPRDCPCDSQSLALPCLPFPSYPIPSHLIQSHPIPSHPISTSSAHHQHIISTLSNPNQPNPIPLYALPTHPTPTHPIPSHPIPRGAAQVPTTLIFDYTTIRAIMGFLGESVGAGPSDFCFSGADQAMCSHTDVLVTGASLIWPAGLSSVAGATRSLDCAQDWMSEVPTQPVRWLSWELPPLEDMVTQRLRCEFRKTRTHMAWHAPPLH